MTSIHAPFTSEVECKMASFTQVRFRGSCPSPDPNDGHDPVPVPEAPLIARAAIGYHAARTRRVSAAGLAPTSGQVVTQIQLGSPRPDSAVRILYAQPASAVSEGLDKSRPSAAEAPASLMCRFAL